MITRGKRVAVAYDLWVDGKLVKSIVDTRPQWYLHGQKKMGIGFEKAVHGMNVGERRSFVLSPKQAHGAVNPKSFVEMPRANFAKRDLFIGKALTSPKDGKFLAIVQEIRKDTIVLNFNHLYAGKSLRYDVHVIAVKGT